MVTKQEIQTMTADELKVALVELTNELKKYSLLKSAGKLTQTHHVAMSKGHVAHIKMRLASLQK